MKTIAIASILSAIVAVILVLRPGTEASPVNTAAYSQPVPTGEKSTTPAPSIPQTIHIPSLSVTASVESVGKDAKGNMDIPKEVMNAAWYNLGSRPGSIGNAVIAGHFDTPQGTPSIFYNLSKLAPGSTIEVKDAQGRTHSYRVTRQALYDTDKFPLIEVFGDTQASRLNLITCSGTWNKQEKNYSKRLVVYSELVSPIIR